MKNKETITAIKGGKTKEFSLRTWQMLPKDKLGWQPFAEMPSEIEKHLNSKKEINSEKVELEFAKEFLKEDLVIEQEINLENEGLEISDKPKRGRKPNADK